MIQLLDLLSSTSPVILAVFAILIIMSVISWSIVFLKTIQLIRLHNLLKRDMRLFRKPADPLSLADLLNRSPRSVVRSMTREALLAVTHRKKLQKSSPSGQEMTTWFHAQTTELLDEKIRSLQSGLPLLAICASTAPLLGLFGTVWGIMRSFHAYAELKTTTLATVGPGIADALSTTALGLMVAIPATLAYNSFLVLLNNRRNDLAYCSRHMVLVFEDTLRTDGAENASVPPRS
jgi:biopolymer transport protein TolQ